MPRMGEDKGGPSRSKLRAIWRAEKRKRDELAGRIARAELAGSTPSVLALELLAMFDSTLAGATPVGITHAAWRGVCAEMNRSA